MSDDQIIALLTEIRDLQKQHLENQKLIMQKQDEAMELQKKNVAEFQNKIAVRQKLVIFTVIAITIVAFLIVFLSSEMLKPLH